MKSLNFSKVSSDIFLAAKERVWMVTSLDVLHCFYVPDFFNKVDAVPGRINIVMNTFFVVAQCEGPRFVAEGNILSSEVSRAQQHLLDTLDQDYTVLLFQELPFHDTDSFDLDLERPERRVDATCASEEDTQVQGVRAREDTVVDSVPERKVDNKD